MGVLLEDDLNTYPAGAAPGWLWTVRNAAGGGAVTIENDPGGTRGRVLKITDTDVADYSEGKLSLLSAVSALVAVLELRLAQTARNVYVGFYVGATRHDVLSFRSDAFVKYRAAGGTWTNFPTPKAYAQNTYYKVRLVLDTAQTSAELRQVTIDDVDQLTSTVNLDNFAGNIDALYVATDSAMDATEAYVNDVQILEKTATLRGRAITPAGAGVPGAKVHVFRLPAGSLLTTATADSGGYWSYSLDAGVMVGVAGYDPAVARGGAAHGWAWAK